MTSLGETLAGREGGVLPLLPGSAAEEDLSFLLHRCREDKSHACALRLRGYMHCTGLDGHQYFGNRLVSMLAEIGSLPDALQIFHRLHDRTESSWNSLIVGLSRCREAHRALLLYENMQELDEVVHLSGYSFIALLKACAELKDLARGQRLHAHVAEYGLENSVFVGSSLVNMYSKCGLLTKAQEVFNKLLAPDRVAWTALIAGHVQNGHNDEALSCFEQMKLVGISPDATTFACALKACGSSRAADKGLEMHAEIAKNGSLERDPLVGTALVDMYGKCGFLSKAQEVFDRLLSRNVVSWNVLMTGYIQHGHSKEALKCYEQMQYENIAPNACTFVCSLKACGNLGALSKGQEIHAEIARKDWLKKDAVLGNALLDMYVKCGSLGKAQEVFDELPIRDVVAWSTLIAGYAEHGCGEQALNCYEQMQVDGVSPNAVTYACSLKACGSLRATSKGLKIHADIARIGSLETDQVIGTALVDMYMKCGLLQKAQEVFAKLSARDVVLWTALIAGYAQHGCGEAALKCFDLMQREGVFPNAVTYVCSLKACTCIGATDKGKEIHAEIARNGLLESDVVVGSALVDMYVKCGLLAKAQEVLYKLPTRNTVSWNALIAGYAQLGESEAVFYHFDNMIAEGIKPDLATFVSLLNACSHTGLLDRAQVYFESMIQDYGIKPTLEHHTCMIDLFGRAGQLDKAILMIRNMPFHTDLVVWHIVLGACQKWANVELGRQAFEHAVRLDHKDPAAYVFMSNIYSDAGMQEDANEIEALRMKSQSSMKLRVS